MIEAGYQSDRILSSTVGDDRLFTELGNLQNVEKLSKILLQNSGVKYFIPIHLRNTVIFLLFSRNDGSKVAINA